MHTGQVSPSFRMAAADWPAFVALLEATGEAWPREAAVADLRWWTCSGRLPSIEVLRRRWVWARNRVRELVGSRTWHDRSLPPPTRPKPRSGQTTNGRTPKMRQRRSKRSEG